MTDLLALLSKGWTPGAVGIWLILASLLLGLWKGLPAVLDAWASSVSKEREHREREIARLEGQIRAGDDRHEECLKGQVALRDEINRLQGIISGMVVQMRQIQLSAMATDKTDAIPPAIAALLSAIDGGHKA